MLDKQSEHIVPRKGKGAKPPVSQVHGHEVMRMMLEKEGGFTKESLCAAITQRFGVGARFYTCSAEGMTALELIDFLAERGKFIDVAQGFQTAAERICHHG